MARCAHSQVFVSSNAVCEQMIPARHALQHTATCHTTYNTQLHVTHPTTHTATCHTPCNTHRYMSHALQHMPLHVSYLALLSLPVIATCYSYHCHCYLSLLQVSMTCQLTVTDSQLPVSTICHLFITVTIHSYLSPLESM